MYNHDTLKIVKDCLVLAGMIGGVIMWFVTMYGLPPRVSKLEGEVQTMQRQLERNDTKTDIILDSVKRMESFILNRHSGGN